MRNGYRIGSYLVLVDMDGLRHAVRVTSILSVSDADMCQDTAVVVAAGRQIIVPVPWQTVMGWIDGDAAAAAIGEEPMASARDDTAPSARRNARKLPDSVHDLDGFVAPPPAAE
jgi:bifunctional DNA-binding transcriptional regulator/antitoxin component of YhaV-PrlF toxin-antitoxin module